MVTGETARKGLAQCGHLLAQRALGQLGQHLGVVRAGDQRLEHPPRRDAEDLRGDRGELDPRVLQLLLDPLYLADALLDLGLAVADHALLVGQMLAQIDFLDETIQTLSERVDELTRPFSRELELLDTIPGVDRRPSCCSQRSGRTDGGGLAELLERRIPSRASFAPGARE